MVKLSSSTLTQLSDELAVPTYDRATLQTGIVHFGVGGFHRAHQAMYLDRLMNQGKALDWAICGVGVLEHDAEKVIEKLAATATRIVSLTVTEGGYNVHHVTGEFNADNPDVQHDLASGASPKTSFGLVVEALKRRRERGIPPFTVMSCDNIQGNGDVAQKMFTAFAELKDPELASWIRAEVPFPNSMVDRITPVTTDEDRASIASQFGVEDEWPVVCEPFEQWVLEDHFANGRPPLQDAGVQLVNDVEPYELMKLRLLNASHQALCYLGYLSGYRYAHEVCQNPDFAKFLLDYMDKEATPTLSSVPGIDLPNYKKTLIDRFSNEYVRDTLARLCAESSDRIPKWLLPVIRINLANDGEISRSVAVVASWARYAEGIDEQGQPVHVVDALKDTLMAAAAHQHEDQLAFIANREVFGDMIDNVRFTEAYSLALSSLHKLGALRTVQNLNH